MLFFISTWGPYRNCDEATTGIYWLEDAINNIVRKGNYKGAEIVEVVSMLYFAYVVNMFANCFALFIRALFQGR